MTTEQQRTGDWVLADAFDRAAPTYDAMVALSPGYHAQLRTAAELLVERLPRPEAGERPVSVLDVGCGSGASTRALLDAWSDLAGTPGLLTVRGVDASQGMVLQAGRSRGPWASSSSWRMPWSTWSPCPDASVDGVLAAYLLRNVPDRDRLVREVARVLRPEGRSPSTTTRWPATPGPG